MPYNFWGSERSQAHTWCVNRVRKSLEGKGYVAEKEYSLVSDRITDAWAHDKKNNIWYLCEIKVQLNDLPKAVPQIHDTARRFKFHPGYIKKGRGVIVPVIAISNPLYKEMEDYYPDIWKSYRELCKTLDIALWVVEQSTILKLQGPKVKPAVKAKATTKTKTATKAKATTKPKATAKAPTKPKAATRAKASTKIKRK